MVRHIFGTSSFEEIPPEMNDSFFRGIANAKIKGESAKRIHPFFIQKFWMMLVSMRWVLVPTMFQGCRRDLF